MGSIEPQCKVKTEKTTRIVQSVESTLNFIVQIAQYMQVLETTRRVVATYMRVNLIHWNNNIAFESDTILSEVTSTNGNRTFVILLHMC